MIKRGTVQNFPYKTQEIKELGKRAKIAKGPKAEKNSYTYSQFETRNWKIGESITEEKEILEEKNQKRKKIEEWSVKKKKGGL